MVSKPVATIVVIPAHVVRNMVVISSRDVLVAKTGRYRVNPCRNVIYTQMVRVPAHVVEST